MKILADELEALNVFVTEGDITITLLESLLSSFENLIVAIETRAMKDLILEYITS